MDVGYSNFLEISLFFKIVIKQNYFHRPTNVINQLSVHK